MKVLWVCNIMLPAIAKKLGCAYSVREGWLSGILDRLLSAEGAGIEPGICFPAQGNFVSLQRKLTLNGKEVSCYGFSEDLEHPERYDAGLEARFGQILADFLPDLVHIFGTEFPHACACAKAWKRPERTLVGIQGVCSAIARSYQADLPDDVFLKRTLRDVLKGDSMRQQQEKFYARAETEARLLRLAGHITGRTDFDREETAAINPDAVYHSMNETMRQSFYAGSWQAGRCRRHEIFASQADYPLKGFHYLLQAMGTVLAHYPDAVVTVAGNSVMGTGGFKSRLKIPAYGKYLRGLVRQNRLEGKIRVLGRLEEEGMKRAYLGAHVFVCPSAVENSPNCVAEAQLLGVPVVASRAGGIPSMVEDGISGLLFEKGNGEELAQKILRIFSSDEEAGRLCVREREWAAKTYDGDANFGRLLRIYEEILA